MAAIRFDTPSGALSIGFKYLAPPEDDVVRMITRATIRSTDKDAKIVASGVALCHRNDVFCKETGRKLALTRAAKGMPRELRAQVWSAYFNRLSR